MKSKKIRKHSGRYTPRIIKPKMKFDEIKEKAFEPNEEYDDWLNYRDGIRDYRSMRNKKRDKQKERKRHPYKRGGKRR